MADYKTPQWLLPNEKNLAYPAAGAETGSGLSEDRHSLYSMDFDGSDYIDLGTGLDIFRYNINESYSVSLWYKATVSGGFKTIINLGANNYRFCLLSATLGRITFGAGNSSTITVTYNWLPSAGAINDGQWHHICIVQDSSGGVPNLTAYVDGSSSGSAAGTTPAITQNNNRIGDGHYGGVEAGIDEVAIWNKALNQSEIDALSVADAPANIMGLNEKPIAYYPLGEQAQMGSANWSFPNGSLQSHVIDFDAADYISTSHISSSSAFSVSAWVNTTDTNTYGNIFSSDEVPVGGSVRNWQFIRWNNKARFILRNSSGSSIVDINTSSKTINDGNWHNIVATWDGTTGTNGVKIYVDNVLEAQGTASSTALANSAIPMVMSGSSATWDFIGKISNIAIWNSDQSANIANIYNNGSPQSTYTTTPTAWWKLNAANSSYVYPWSLELNGNPNVGGGGDHAKVVSNDLEIRDITTSGKVDFLTREITGAYSGINVTGEFRVYAASAGPSGATLYYKIDSGSWVQFQQELRTDNIATTYAISGASGLTSTTSFQVKIEFETGDAGSAYVTLNNISIGGLYTEDFTNQDGAGWDNDAYTPPPVDWTFIDTETPAPNYSSALNFDGTNDYIDCGSFSALNSATTVTVSAWFKSSTYSTLGRVLSNQAIEIYQADSSYSNTQGRFYYRLRGNFGNQFALLGGTSVSGVGNLVDGDWHHLCITFDNSTTTAIVYEDGVAVLTNTSVTGTLNSAASNLYIGSSGASSNFIDGSISNISIFNTVLDAAAISTLFNSGTPQTSISSSPISWWKLDNTTTGIQDSGSASNNGTNNGATQIATNVLISNNGESDTLPTSALTPSDLQFESPYSNYSLDFDGTGNYIDGNTASYLNATTTFTISTWFNTDTVAGTDKFLINIGGSSSELWGIQLYQGDLIAYGSTTAIYYRYNGHISINEWYHLTLVYDGSESTGSRYKVYLNGTLLVSDFAPGTVPTVTPTFTNNLIIGKLAYSAAEYWNGKIDETAIWNSALTQAQISQVYNNGYPADLTSLSPVSWWRLGEDAYFVGNDITVPNQIIGGPTGTGSGTQTAILVGDAPGSYANGSGTNLAVEDRIGDAPESTANSVSKNMIPSNRISYPAGYVPTQVDNVYSMEFDGADDYVNLGNGVSFEYTNSFSYSFWVKPEAISGVKYLYSKYDSGRGILIYYNSAGASTSAAISLDLYNTNSGSTATRKRITTATGNILTKNVWSNIVITYDGSGLGSGIELYKDGASQTVTVTQDNLQNNTIVNTENAYLGSYNGTGSFFPGNLDEVAIFNYALSARQIKQDIYEGTTAGGKTADLNNISNLTAPVAWYRMGD